MTVWVKFHDALRKGSKRAVPRASRFVFLEICIEARPLLGEIELRTDMDAHDAVHDLLGGNRDEVRKAVDDLMRAGMVHVDESADGRRLTIPSWEHWNKADESTERVKRWRAKKREPATQSETVCNVTRNVTATVASTFTQQGREEESREEKKRAEETGARAPEDAPPPGLPSRRLSERGQAVAKRIADPIHADLFGSLTKQEIAAAIARIDGPLQHVERADWWQDIDTEVDSWVSYARSKGEGRGWSPTQHLGAVEDLGRTRCRERGGKARIEREKRRQGIARTGGVVEMDNTTVKEDLVAAANTVPTRIDPEPPPLTPEERKKRIADLAARLGRGAA